METGALSGPLGPFWDSAFLSSGESCDGKMLPPLEGGCPPPPLLGGEHLNTVSFRGLKTPTSSSLWGRLLRSFFHPQDAAPGGHAPLRSLSRPSSSSPAPHLSTQHLAPSDTLDISRPP